ncbi:MAG TPA: hypothetical protein EYP62_06865 [Kiritimatiellae bacterium]|nr:hypothetical protein [Kiritimatiellia bacterium]
MRETLSATRLTHARSIRPVAPHAGGGAQIAAGGTTCMIVWRTVPEGWLKRAGRIRTPGQMPWLVGEQEVAQLTGQKRETFTGEPGRLIRGILLCWFEPEKYHWDEARHGPLREFLLLALEDLWEAERFGPFEPEEQVLFCADLERRKHRRLLATRMLAAGHAMLPTSTDIRVRLLLDTWDTLDEVPKAEQESVLEFLARLYRGAQLADLDSGIRERLALIHLQVLARLGRRGEQGRFFWRTASKQIREPETKQEMLRLMRNPRSEGSKVFDNNTGQRQHA